MSRHQPPGSSSSPTVPPGSPGTTPHPAGGRKGAAPANGSPGGRKGGTHNHRSPQGEDGFLARGVVWLGMPAGAHDDREPPATSRRNPALQLLGYPHGPRILDVLRSGGR